MHWLPGFRFALLNAATDGGDGGGAGDGQKTPEKKDPPAAGDDVATLKAKIAELESAVAARKKADDKANEEKLKADGKLQELLNQKEQELEGLKSDAELGKSYRTRESKRIEEKLKTLSEADQALVKAQPTIDLQAQLLDRLTANAGDGKKEPAKAGAQGNPVGNASEIDFAEAFKDPAKWAEAKERDAKGASAWFQKQALGSTQPVSFQRQRPAKSA